MDFEGSVNVMSLKWAFVSPPEYLKKKQWSHLATTIHTVRDAKEACLYGRQVCCTCGDAMQRKSHVGEMGI